MEEEDEEGEAAAAEECSGSGALRVRAIHVGVCRVASSQGHGTLHAPVASSPTRQRAESAEREKINSGDAFRSIYF